MKRVVLIALVATTLSGCAAYQDFLFNGWASDPAIAYGHHWDGEHHHGHHEGEDHHD